MNFTDAIIVAAKGRTSEMTAESFIAKSYNGRVNAKKTMFKKPNEDDRRTVKNNCNWDRFNYIKN